MTVFLSFCSCRVNRPSFESPKNSSGIALKWLDLLAELSRKTPYSPPQSIRIYVYSSLAMYECTMPERKTSESILKLLTGHAVSFENNKYYLPACINSALGRLVPLLMVIYPRNNDLGAVELLQNYYDSLFTQSISPDMLERSNAFGKKVADSIFNWSKNDETVDESGKLMNCPEYIPVQGPGSWVPTPPDFTGAAGYCQGNVRSFLSAGPEVQSPPAFSQEPGSQFYREAENIIHLRSQLSTADSLFVESWRDLALKNYNPPSHVLKLTLQIIAKENFDLRKTTLILALHCMAVNDAIKAVFREKFHYHVMRPVTYIRQVIGKKDWVPVIPTLQHPAYPSSLVSGTAAALTVLEKFVGKNYSFIDSTQSSLYNSRVYTSFDDFINEAGRSRVYSGINFQFSVNAGIELGKSVAEAYLKLPLKN
jgi:hypothetical protein